MRFDKAYCEELECYVTPYLARELYFDKESEYYLVKLHFACPDLSCKVELVGVNIYNEKRNKKALHFRTKQNVIHNCARYAEKGLSKPSESKAGEEEGFKPTRYPSEFLLERPKSGKAKTIIEVEEFEESSGEISSNHSKNPAPNSKNSRLKTSCLDHIVDCYLSGDQSELKRQPLTINGKTRSFFSYFKKIKYYKDEEGLIYWGEVKDIKKYGKNYRILFKDWATVDEKRLSISIYIENDLIETYRKNKMFRIQVDELIKAERPVLCFFVGAYPQLTEVDGKTKFEALKVEITNLDHISFTFSDED